MLTKEEAQGQTHESIQAIVGREYPALLEYVERRIQSSIKRGVFECSIDTRGYHPDGVSKITSELRNRNFIVTEGWAPKSIRVAWMR